MLSAADELEFSVLRDGLDVADSVVSKQLKVLVDAGYVRLTKPTGMGGKVRTWASLTPSGRKAFSQHLAALQQMISSAHDLDPGRPSTRSP